MSLIELNKNGIYCPQADVYIDPWKAVDKALITHGHSDHGRRGHKNYLCTDLSVPILKKRLGSKISISGLAYGEVLNVNGVKISFHPAGHIIGSAQIKLEHKGVIWVITGDYKIEDDGISGKYYPVKCNHFITESTFGLPIYKWESQKTVFGKISNWWSENKRKNKVSIISAYSLGKAQRLLANLSKDIGEIYCHKTIYEMNETIRKSEVPLPNAKLLKEEIDVNNLKGSIVITPSASSLIDVLNTKVDYSLAMASGWMMTKGGRWRGVADKGFVLSDHCDWEALNEAVKSTGAENIYPTHGFTEIYAKWLRGKGYNALALETEFVGDDLESTIP